MRKPPKNKSLAPQSHLVETWLSAKGWKPFAFQRAAWDAYLCGDSGLVHAATGMGKSYAVWLGIVEECLREQMAYAAAHGGELPDAGEPLPLRALWITPMRALANDLVNNLSVPIHALDLPWSIELRTGDTTQSMRKKQRLRLPTTLVTTPESLSLLLSYPEARKLFQTLRCVVVDEWHELLETKRGVQTELGLARLRSWLPNLRTWGLSATLANLEQALGVLLGQSPDATTPPPGVLIPGDTQKDMAIETILPPDIERFPWAGHLGLKLLKQTVERIEAARSTLVFTNTRSQCEIWFSAILHARPDWAGSMALHHGSLDRDIREYVEGRLRLGDLKCCVCTSSLDLGVDFSPVDQVLQIGSPKGIARLLQRAGRSGHQPGRRAASSVCRRTRLNWWSMPRRASRRSHATSKAANRWTGRWISWCSTSVQSRSPKASSPMSYSPRFAGRMPLPV